MRAIPTPVLSGSGSKGFLLSKISGFIKPPLGDEIT